MSALGTWLFGVMGGLFLLNSVVIGLLAILHRKRGIPVTAEVVAMRETTTSDDGPASAPVFRILDGEHAGTVWESWASSSPDMHQVGDVVPAFYDPKSGVIQSGAVRSGSVWLALGMFAASIACFWIAATY